MSWDDFDAKRGLHPRKKAAVKLHPVEGTVPKKLAGRTKAGDPGGRLASKAKSLGMVEVKDGNLEAAQSELAAIKATKDKIAAARVVAKARQLDSMKAAEVSKAGDSYTRKEIVKALRDAMDKGNEKDREVR